MKDLSKYAGIIPAFYACYDEKGDISPKAVRELTQYYIDKGVKGLYVGGSSGECIYQTVPERKLLLDEIVRSGTTLDAAVSSELLKNIFFVKAPMHDGAVIIRNGRVLGAGCMLPLSKNVNLSRDLGMRHRAGIGMSENSDAVVVIVSEETGSISVAIGGMLKRHLKPETLENLLRNELLPREEDSEDRLKFNLLNLLRSKKNGGEEDA